MDRHSVFFLVLLIVCMPCVPHVLSTNQSEFFILMKHSLSGNYPKNWDLIPEKPVCNFTGVICSNHGHVTNLDISGWSLSGIFPTNICSYLPELRVLRLSQNLLRGNFLESILNCSNLEEINMSNLSLHGTLPDFSPLKSLKILDLSYNLFTGQFPMSIFNLSNLEVLNFNENEGFNFWKLPEDVYGMKNLKTLVLSTCMVFGEFPKSVLNLTSLVDLELSGNYLAGRIPPELGLLKNLQSLELYYNQLLDGDIPEEFGNLTELRDLDMSVNRLTGRIPDSIWRLPKLEVLQLYNNSLTGEIPEFIENSTTLRMLSLYDNFLIGQVPRNLGRFSPMMVIDLSENNLSGPLPTEVCRGGSLMYFLVLNNMFSGEIPDSYAKCSTLLRFRVTNNHLNGSIPEGLLGLPHATIIDLSNNFLTGTMSETIGNSKNLSELFLQKNRISGVIPPAISQATNLVKIDLSNNLISGSIPCEIGNLKRLNLLMLQGNKLNSSIPSSLSLLQSLNFLDLSNNLLTGNIPESFSRLLPNSINFSNNSLSGPIPPSLIKGGFSENFAGNPGLCVAEPYNQDFPVCSRNCNKRKLNIIWTAVISAVLIIIGVFMLMKRKCSSKFQRGKVEEDETLPSSFFSCDVKSFYDRKEIMEKMVEQNMVGHGGSGKVYKIQLKSGELVAVKRLSNQKLKNENPDDRFVWDKTLNAEVETLGSVRHKNIVRLYCYFTSSDSSLLVYEYMENGNLWNALHEGWIHLDWPTRHQIAVGIARGLAYLHHDLVPAIVHRDVKSTNILLDVNCQPKVADFGVAKVMQARGGKDATASAIVGTYGYLAPEYAYSSRATTKCDVYSFGVVLMELITGKKPVEAEFGENKNIVYWVSNKVESKELNEVFDKRLSDTFKLEMIEVLRIAIRCSFKNPANRPTMKEVVQMLVEADPCSFYYRQFSNSNKTQEPSGDYKVNYSFLK